MKERISGLRNESSKTKRTGLFQRITAAFLLPFIFIYKKVSFTFLQNLSLLLSTAIMERLFGHTPFFNLTEQDTKIKKSLVSILPEEVESLLKGLGDHRFFYLLLLGFAFILYLFIALCIYIHIVHKVLSIHKELGYVTKFYFLWRGVSIEPYSEKVRPSPPASTSSNDVEKKKHEPG